MYYDPELKSAIREEFYLLCAIRFGMDTLEYPHDFQKFGNFRKELYPDYFNNDAIPTMDLMSFLIWCKDKKNAA